MKTVHILFLVVGFSISTPTSAAKKLVVRELLDRYSANQDKLNSSVIVKLESDAKIFQNNEPYFYRVEPSEVRMDGQKYFACVNNKYDKVSDTTLPLDETDYIAYTLWDGERGIQYYDFVERSKAYIDRQYESRQNEPGGAFMTSWPGSPLFGIRYLKTERIDTQLRQCETLSVRDEMGTIGSEACYVIDAKSPTSTYTVWLNPKRGYSISHAVIKHGPGTQGAFTLLSENEDRSLTISDVRFRQIGEVHVPMVYNLYLERRRDGVAYRHGTIRGKVTDISFNPDHEKLASFVPKMRNGTLIRDRETPGIEYKWKDGMKFVVDDWDDRIRYVPEDWAILIGAGKPLPEFEGIDLEITTEYTRDKALLLCFFNKNQRPSRNCLLQLSKRAKELMAKDVVVASVQASKIDDNVLNEWVEKNNIPFSVGMVQGDEEKIRFTWGVRSLPWLILTDKKHIVIAEGFGIDTLDEKLKEVSTP